MTEQELIDNVMDNFDFHKVSEVMQMLKWRWAYCNDEGGIPTEPTMRKEVRKQISYLLMRSEGKDMFYTATGGFWYTAYREEGKLVAINLKFCVIEWQAEDFE